ncbi:MAG: PAS domain-containing protein, partial [Proteobacteria bacterium]|nr:PAS domain-containing protein [Pseudomonadota bacterium]
MSLDTAEWILAAAGTVTVSYAFYVTWVAGLDPIWITGTTLIIIGVLNYLTGTKQAIAFALFTLLIGAISMLHQNPDQLMAPNAVFFNFVTAIAIGFFSSLQRNRHPLDLIQLESKQDIVLSTMREGVILHDASGVIISINDSARKILGLTKDQILGKSNVDPQWKTFLEDGNPCPPEMHPSAVAQPTGRPVENFLLKLQKVNGKISWLSISAMPTFEPGRSAPVATVVTIQDITDQKLKEEKIRSQEVSLMLASRLSGLGE